jgi:hypothetical protein
MNGYQYDSFNSDVLINRAKFENGKISFGGGIEYGAILFPGSHKMAPNKILSLASAEKILQLAKDGATIFVDEKPNVQPGLQSSEDFKKWQNIINEIWRNANTSSWKIGKGTIIKLPYLENNFASIGIEQDLYFPKLNRADSETIAWAHRKSDEEDIYFISNQKQTKRSFETSFRIAGKIPVWYNPVTDTTSALANWKIENGRTIVDINLDANESGFVIFKENTKEVLAQGYQKGLEFENVQTLDENWELQFDPKYKGPKEIVKINKLFDWSTSENEQIKYYSGTAVYKKDFVWKGKEIDKMWIDLGEIANIAEIKINGKDCGTLWTLPYKTAISQALKKGKNTIEIKITNTWANRLMGDQKLPKEQRATWTNATYRLEGEPLLKAGLLGPIMIIKEK